jgi:CDP-paratose 2-epimerase
VSYRLDGWRPGDQPVYVSDLRKAERRLGWAPRTNWRAGIDCLHRWVNANRELLERLL